MANWLEEMIARVLSGGGDQYPGYTQSRMMANQGPMGSPTQDPAQFDVPYRSPYGEGSVLQRQDTDGAPFGMRKKRTSYEGGMGYADTADSLNARVGGGYPHTADRDLVGRLHGRNFFGEDLSTPDDAMELLREVAKRRAIAKLMGTGGR